MHIISMAFETELRIFLTGLLDHIVTDIVILLFIRIEGCGGAFCVFPDTECCPCHIETFENRICQMIDPVKSVIKCIDTAFYRNFQFPFIPLIKLIHCECFVSIVFEPGQLLLQSAVRDQQRAGKCLISRHNLMIRQHRDLLRVLIRLVDRCHLIRQFSFIGAMRQTVVSVT